MPTRCPACAKENDGKTSRCPHCGKDLPAPPAPPRTLPRRGRFPTTPWEEAPPQSAVEPAPVRRSWLSTAAALAAAATLCIFGGWLWRRAARLRSIPEQMVSPAEIASEMDVDQRPPDLLVDKTPTFPIRSSRPKTGQRSLPDKPR